MKLRNLSRQRAQAALPNPELIYVELGIRDQEAFKPILNKPVALIRRWGRWACPRSLVLAILSACVPLNAIAQLPQGREVSFPTTIQWNKQRGIAGYRLQIAADERFRDVVFDRRVTGERFVVAGLPAGYYYWRVAPGNTAPANYSWPARFFISGGVITGVKLPNRTAGAR